LTVIHGDNGEGKTNLLEAVGWVATLSSFRGSPPDALIRADCPTAVVRTEGSRDERPVLIEASISRTGRNRVQVNRQPLRRARDLLGALRVTVFSPDDLAIVKGGPSLRRLYLDDLLVASHPRWDAVRSDVDRILRQRGVLLKQARGRLTPEVETTLDVWDDKLVAAGSELASARASLIGQLAPAVASAYESLAGAAVDLDLSYWAAWQEVGLAAALAAARNDDLRRGVSTVGPHRDDLVITLSGLPGKTHASQGEQRSIALALRLGGDAIVRAVTGDTPVLLLDDVFSELDPRRSAALCTHLPPGQAFLTTAGPLPPDLISPARVLTVRDGTVSSL
jgi:DNA replication and repair protein RecF